MGTRVLAIAFCSKLVALVTSPADSPADGTSCPGRPCRSSIWVLTVLLLRPGASEMWVVDANMLLELLEGVVGSLGEGVEAGCVKVPVGNMPVGEKGVLRDVVGREAVER